MTDTKYPEDLLNLENIGIYGSVIKLGYHELNQKLYDAIEYGYTRGKQDASVDNNSDDIEWTNFTELAKSTESYKIDYTKLDGRKVKIVAEDEDVFSLHTTISLKSYDIRPDTVYSYKLFGLCDLSDLLVRSWHGTHGLSLYIEGDIMKKQRTADTLSVGERVSLRSLLTDEVWKDAVCVSPGNIIGYSDKSNGLELLDEDLENIVIEEELGDFEISSVSS